jgi:hypothetical protein
MEAVMMRTLKENIERRLSPPALGSEDAAIPSAIDPPDGE